MTPDQVRLVQSSFATLAPQAEAAATAFYDCLFALDPGLQRLFPGDMAEQRRKLMAALAVALPGVDPVTTAFETVPLIAVFELSIWLSVAFERRWVVHRPHLSPMNLGLPAGRTA